MLRFTRDFNIKSRKLFFFCFFLLFLSAFSLSLESVSEIQKSFPLIKKISIMIDGQPNGQDMSQLIPVKEGEPFSLKKINKSIKQIYRTGLFSDIQVLKEGEEEIELTYLLTRRLLARRILFVKKPEISRKRLHQGLFSLREGVYFTEEQLSKAIQELRESLHSAGYFDPEINARTKKDPSHSTVDVFFTISSAKTFIISKIAFSGQTILTKAELKKKMKSKEGKRYVPSLLEEDIESLKEVYNEIDFQRAEIEVQEVKFDEKTGSVDLFLKVLPNEKIEIMVRGASIPLNLLRPIWEAKIFEEWGLAEGESKIISQMRKKGYLFASVRSSIEKEDHKMRIIYVVSPNEKYKISDISFSGINYFTPEKLKEELGIGEKTAFLKWIDGESLFEMPEEIEFLYRTRGFPNTRVDLCFITKGNKVEALFYIDEKNQEKIEKITIEGASLFNSQTLFSQIQSREGGPFFQLDIQKDIEKLENFYLNQGIRGTEILARIEKVADDIYSVDFNIEEGNRVKIENIVITGNNVTRRKKILREMKIREGDDAFYDKINESKRRLERLGIFTKVEIEEIPLSPDRMNLLISVREGERNYASLGLGLETKTEPQSFALWNNPVRLRGIAELIRNNVLGSGAQLSLVGQLSLKEKRSVLSWEQPSLFGIQMKTYLNAWLERESRKSFTYDRKGISLTAIKNISKEIVFLSTIRFAETTLVDLQIAESEVDRQLRPFSATSLSGSFIWDNRDDSFNTGKGAFFSLALEKAFPLFKDESDYWKSFIKYQHYFPIFPDVTFSLTSRFGLGGGRKDIPIHERFFAGGSNSFRGARFDELGPKDANSLMPIGGETLFLLNFEFVFPLVSTVKNLSAAFFYDTGNVFDKLENLKLNSLQSALGLGIRYRTPLGPVRLEVAWNLDAPSQERKALFFITIGNVF